MNNAIHQMHVFAVNYILIIVPAGIAALAIISIAVLAIIVNYLVRRRKEKRRLKIDTRYDAYNDCANEIS